jgi:ketosteroid isomerase-like protein
MSLENVEIAWRAVEAFNRTFAAGTDDFFELLDDDVEWVSITALLDGTAYRGRDAVRKWIDDLRRDWETYEVAWEEVRDLDDDRVLAIGSWNAVGRRSGVELHLQQAAWLVHFRNGKLIRLQTFSDRSDALEAVGLHE